MRNREALRKAGSHGYKSTKKQLNKRGPVKPIVIEMSIFKLLKTSGLSNNGNNRIKLDYALNRLLEPIGEMPAPLISWQRLPSGMLELEVSEEWLRPPFVRVPLPLPHKSAIALDLYKFLVSFRTGPTNSTCISIEWLCRKIGIPGQLRSSWVERRLKRALDVVNKHLDGLPLDALYQHGIKVPEYYTLEPMKDDLLRFESMPRQYRNEDDDNEAKTTPPARKIGSRRRVWLIKDLT
jgi:hypothetical protein